MPDQSAERIAFVGLLGVAAFAFTQQALVLQRTETNRRLHDLNNEAGRLQAAVSANVSADTWNAFVDAYGKDLETEDGRFKAVERFQNKLLGAMALAVIIVPILTGVLVWVLTKHTSTG